MDLTSFQPACMDTSDWLQGTFHEESPVESGSPTGEMISCSRPAALLERRLRPQQEQALKCPRCDSTHTKFCYYNNYSLSQPRYFCKTCRRYWTKGGSLRNVPVGGGCRKNKKTAVAAGKKSIEQPPNQFLRPPPHDPTDLHLSFSGLHFPHLNSLLGHPNNSTECKYDQMQWNPRNGDSAAGDTKMDYAMGNSRNYSFMGSNDQLVQMGGLGEMSHEQFLGFPFDGFHGERLLLPFGGVAVDHQDPNEVETKPSNSRLLSLEWNNLQQQGKDSYGYLMNGVGSWSGVINGYGSSTANPLV